jgi:hypothetical protein
MFLTAYAVVCIHAVQAIVDEAARVAMAKSGAHADAAQPSEKCIVMCCRRMR